MCPNANEKPAPKLIMAFVGVLFTAVAILLSIPVAPMLLFARDKRDMIGGIAGSVVMLIVGLTGIVLIFREKTPALLMRAFYFALGGLAVLAGVGMIGYSIYEMTQGVRVNKAAISMPLLFIVIGADWIRRGMKVTNVDASDSVDTG